MSSYEVHFTWQSRQYVEVVVCSGQTAAVAAIKARYPGARIGFVRRVR